MDPASAFGIATAVIGLIPLCAQGFEMITACFNAPESVKEAMTLVTVQKVLFISWGATLGLTGLSEQNAIEVLKNRMPHWELIGSAVLDILATISDTFANVVALEGSYGLILPEKYKKHINQQNTVTLKHPDIWKKENRDKLKKRRSLMESILLKCKFVLSGSKKFDAFAHKLYIYNDGLLKLCSLTVVQMTYNAMLPEMLSGSEKNKPHHDPETVANVARKLADNQEGYVDQRQRAGYDLLSAASAFRRIVQDELAKSFKPLSISDYEIKSGDWAIKDGKNDLATMTCRQSSSHSSEWTIYYIEWKSYRTHKNEQDEELEREIQSLAKVACITQKPADFRVLDCLGAFKDNQKSRYGFVYSLPSYLRTVIVKDLQPGDISKRRKPVSLLMLMEESPGSIPKGLDLGSRIALARQLAQSLLVLHAAGWVHKNVCSQCIIFFRDCSGTGSGPSTTGRLDYKSPYLCGFGKSRPDYGPEMPPAGARDVPTTYINPSRKQMQSVKESLHQHPAKRRNPKTYYESSFDLYSLGCVLLEIALWQPLSEFALSGDESPYTFRERLIGLTRREMPGQVGNIYAEITRHCLEIRAGASAAEKKKYSQLCWKVVGELDKCVI